MVNVDALREQLTETEVEFEQAKAHLYRCDGSIQLLKHLIAQAEKPETPAEDAEKPAE